MEKKTITLKIKSIDGVEVKMQEKDLTLSSFKVLDEVGTFEAHVSVFGNVDSYGEIVDKGAFTAWLSKYAGRYPKGVWAHNWDEPIIKTLECYEDDIGLYVKGQFVLGVQRAREIYELMKAGVITDFSFGFQVMADSYDEGTGLRHLKEIAIYEYSPVLVGANRDATLLGVKSAVKEGEDGGEAAAPAADAPAPEAEAEITPAETPAPEAAPAAPAAGEAEAGAETTPAIPSADAPAPESASAPTEEAKSAAITAAIDALKAATLCLEALKAPENAAPASVAETPKVESARGEESSDTPHRVVRGILRDAREAKGAMEKVIVRAKSVLAEKQ